MTSANERRPRRVPGAGGEQTAGGDVTSIVRRPADKSLPYAEASAYRPTGGRRLWAISVRCRSCGYVHMHRGDRVEDIDGQVRTGNCGATYRVRVRRVYPAREAA